MNSKNSAEILAFTPQNILRAAEALRQGDVVAMPTETVYGLAGNALDPQALTRIFQKKERPTFDPLIVHVGFSARGLYALASANLIDLKPLSELAQTRAETLIQHFWPGPLTLVLPRSAQVPDLVTSGLPSVALRMPRHSAAQALIAAAAMPLAAPSANRFGRISPTTARAVFEELGDRIGLILDGGPCEIGLESTVVRVENDGALTWLRPGGVTREEIQAVTGSRLETPISESTEPAAGLASPGSLQSHYAPLKPLTLLPRAITELVPGELGTLAGPAALLAFRGERDALSALFTRATFAGTEPVMIRVLSQSDDSAEAARGFFQALREMDASAATHLYAEPCPWNEGLGHAIADRLRRAAGIGS